VKVKSYRFCKQQKQQAIAGVCATLKLKFILFSIFFFQAMAGVCATLKLQFARVIAVAVSISGA
jgi:hypothetical protein